MNLKVLKTSLILGLGASIGANVILAVFVVGIVSSPVLFPPENYCDVEKEYLKIRDSLGKRYHHLPMEQKQQYDDDYHSLLTLNTTQEEFDFHYEGILGTYGLDGGAFYSDEEIRSMFWGWMNMCE